MLAIYITSMLIGGLYALVIPTLSVFLANELYVRPILIGLFFVCTSLSIFLQGQAVAFWTDKIEDRRKLISAAMMLGGLACFGFAIARSYALVLLISVTLYSLAFVAVGQIFEIAKEFSAKAVSEKQARVFNYSLRAFIALAWMLGPPLAFASLKLLDFGQHYATAGVLYFVVALAALYFLPNTVKAVEIREFPEPQTHTRSIYITVIAFSLLFSANQVFLVVLPLYLQQQLAVDSFGAGWVFGLAAGLEIPMLFLAGWLTLRFRLMSLIKVAAFAAFLLNIGLWQATALWHIYALQILNAIFIGFISGVGITWFYQRKLGAASSSSTLFFQSINLGGVMGSIAIVLLAENYGYRHLFAANAVVCFIAMAMLFVISRRMESKPAQL